jgi:hypothetical protein
MQESGITPSNNPQPGQSEDLASQSSEHASALEDIQLGSVSSLGCSSSASDSLTYFDYLLA